jgi:hypothetical protein
MKFWSNSFNFSPMFLADAKSCAIDQYCIFCAQYQSALAEFALDNNWVKKKHLLQQPYLYVFLRLASLKMLLIMNGGCNALRITPKGATVAKNTLDQPDPIRNPCGMVF